MNHKEHNGWYNYETWAVALWMDNEQGSQEYWREQANDVLANPGAYYTSSVLTPEECSVAALEDQIKAHHEEALPELNGFASDLLNAAMSEVNWREIAKHLIDAAKTGANT